MGRIVLIDSMYYLLLHSHLCQFAVSTKCVIIDLKGFCFKFQHIENLQTFRPVLVVIATRDI